MGKTGSEKRRLNSLPGQNDKIGDVKLSEFADSSVPCRRGRMSKSKNVLSQVRQISKSEDVDVISAVDIEEESDSEPLNTLPSDANAVRKKKKVNNDQYTEYPINIWLLVAEYIRPEDVKSFSLICKNTLSVINTPYFWIRLYKRYYRKIDMPKCLSYQTLEIRKSLKQRVIRSLYYFYAPFSLKTRSVGNNTAGDNTLIGKFVLHTGVKRIQKKDFTSDEGRWLYTFKLCGKNTDEIWSQITSSSASGDLHHNPESECRLMKIICKEYVAIPNVIGMRLRNMDNNIRSTTMKFSAAPLSGMGSRELSMATVHLHPTEKPSVIPWWHPDYWDHDNCCNKKIYPIRYCIKIF